MGTFFASRAQHDELTALSYWIADRACSRERGELDEHEQRRTASTIRAIFDALDRLGVPYWVQNAVVCWSEDWRRTLCEDLRTAMQAKDIEL